MTQPNPNTVTLQEAEEIIRAEYNRIWNDWYEDRDDLIPAQLVFSENNDPIQSMIDRTNLEHGYRNSVNTIYFVFMDGDLTNFRRVDMVTEQPDWYSTLIHEMLHEYQIKGFSTPRGNELCNQFERNGNTTFGIENGHNQMWYSAIERHAEYLGLTPEELIRRL